MITQQTKMILLNSEPAVRIQQSSNLLSDSTNLPAFWPTHPPWITLLPMYQLMSQSEEGRQEKVGMYIVFEPMKKENLNKRTWKLA